MGTLSSITDEGYIVHRRKGSKDNLILWSQRLRTAYSDALRLHKKRDIRSIFLIPSTSGRKLNSSTLKSAMTRLKKKMADAGLKGIYWDLHDLKRKGISDAKDDRIGGHKTEEMRNRYKTIIEKFEPPK